MHLAIGLTGKKYKKNTGIICLIERAMDTQSVLGSPMGVDHRGLQVGMIQEVLNRTYILSVLKQMGGKRVPQCMDGHPFGDTRS